MLGLICPLAVSEGADGFLRCRRGTALAGMRMRGEQLGGGDAVVGQRSRPSPSPVSGAGDHGLRREVGAPASGRLVPVDPLDRRHGVRAPTGVSASLWWPECRFTAPPGGARSMRSCGMDWRGANRRWCLRWAVEALAVDPAVMGSVSLVTGGSAMTRCGTGTTTCALGGVALIHSGAMGGSGVFTPIFPTAIIALRVLAHQWPPMGGHWCRHGSGACRSGRAWRAPCTSDRGGGLLGPGELAVDDQLIRRAPPVPISDPAQRAPPPVPGLVASTGLWGP